MKKIHVARSSPCASQTQLRLSICFLTVNLAVYVDLMAACITDLLGPRQVRIPHGVPAAVWQHLIGAICNKCAKNMSAPCMYRYSSFYIFIPTSSFAFAVLGVSLLLEGYSLLVAIRTVTAGAASQGLPFAEFVKRGMDPTSIAVMMEDGAACAGLIIAG